jgi:hypothetical protein
VEERHAAVLDRLYLPADGRLMPLSANVSRSSFQSSPAGLVSSAFLSCATFSSCPLVVFGGLVREKLPLTW